MAYGRLDIFYPDGTFKSAPLDADTVSIGRASGNTILIDQTSLSRYHAALHYRADTVIISDLDSINGTFVDGVRLASGKEQPLSGGEEIVIGDIRMVFRLFDDSPTRPIPILDETQRITLPEIPFSVTLHPPPQAIAPGAHISTSIIIANTGTTSERYRVQIDGLPEGWARYDRGEVSLAPGASEEVVVSIRPRRRPESAPGSYRATAIVSAVNNPDRTLIAPFKLDVLSYGGFGMALDQRTVSVGHCYNLFVHNQGSAPLALIVTARSVEGRLRFSPPIHRLTLPPGERQCLQGYARPVQPRLFGDPVDHSFDLIARSGDAAAFTAASRVTLEEQPMLPGWAVFAAGGIGFALLALILFGLVIALQPAARLEPTALPVPTASDVPALVIEYLIADPDPLILYVAQSLSLDWSVRGADTIRILGLDAFSSAPIDAVYGATGTLTLAGIPEAPLTLTILAEGANGILEQRVTLPTIIPECTAIGDLPLHVMPDGASQVIATVPAGARVVVDAQDQDRVWLRAQLSGGARGWARRSDFECDPQVPLDNLRIELIIPQADAPAPAFVPTALPTIAG